MGLMGVKDEDQDLVKRCQKGDEVAFEALIRKYQQTVFNLVYHFMGGRRDVIEDVAQKIFIKLYFSLPKFNADRPFHPWLYRITVNQCYDELRTIKRNRIVTFTDLQVEDNQAQERLIYAHAAPRERLDQEWIIRVLDQVLDSLPAQYRTALILRDIEELDYEEIGAVFQCSVQAARLKVFRARLRMRRNLNKLLKRPVTDRSSVCRSDSERGDLYAL